MMILYLEECLDLKGYLQKFFCKKLVEDLFMKNFFEEDFYFVWKNKKQVFIILWYLGIQLIVFMMVDRFGVIDFSVIRVCRNVVDVFIFVILRVIKLLKEVRIKLLYQIFKE